MYPKKNPYSQLPNEENHEENESDTNISSNVAHLSKSERISPRLFMLLNVLILLVSTTSLVINVILFKWNSRPTDERADYLNNMNSLLKETSFYSPLLDRHPIPLESKFINNTIFAPSIFRQFPSPEVDEAWDDVASFGLTYITAPDVEKLGKDPTLTVHHPNNSDAHLATISVNHQIHCLNDIRRNLHPEYYYPNGFHSPLHWDHVYHCVHLILQTLQCNADVGIITWNWMETLPNPVPDFSYNMICRDFDGLHKWQSETMMPVQEMRWERQGGEKEIPVPPRLRELNEAEAKKEKLKGEH